MWLIPFWGLTLVLSAAALLFLTASPGPDYGNYINWAEAFRFADIFKLKSLILSPKGIPLNQWSPGPGLSVATIDLFTGNGVQLGHSAFILYGIGTVIFWRSWGKYFFLLFPIIRF